MMRVLLKAGADPDRADNSGRSARDYADPEGPSSRTLAEIEPQRHADGAGRQRRRRSLRAELLIDGRRTTCTLDELRLALAPEIAAAAVFDGWTDARAAQAAALAGVDPAVARLAFPGGAMDMIGAWIERIDADDAGRASADDALAGLKVRERIRTLLAVPARRGRRQRGSAAPRAGDPGHAAEPRAHAAARLAQRRPDVAARRRYRDRLQPLHQARDPDAASTAATLAVFVDDKSEGKAETRAFLDRRIDGVMRFEKAKAQLLQNREGFDVARFLGRLRYPAR